MFLSKFLEFGWALQCFDTITRSEKNISPIWVTQSSNGKVAFDILDWTSHTHSPHLVTFIAYHFYVHNAENSNKSKNMQPLKCGHVNNQNHVEPLCWVLPVSKVNTQEMTYGLERQCEKLTFMQPRRLARSMTRNFLMRSLGRRKKRKKASNESLWKFAVCLFVFF